MSPIAPRLAIMIACLFFYLSCGQGRLSPTPEKPAAFSLQDLNPKSEKKWRQKVIDRLWNKSERSSAENQKLMQLGQGEFLDAIVNDSRFADTVLDFNVFFLGFHNTAMKFPDETVLSSFSLDNIRTTYQAYTPAVHSAKEFLKGGDYLSILTFPKVYYLTPLQGEDFDGDTERVTQATRDQLNVMKDTYRSYLELKKSSQVWTSFDVCAEPSYVKGMPNFYDIAGDFNILNVLTRYITNSFSDSQVVYSVCIEKIEPGAPEENTDNVGRRAPRELQDIELTTDQMKVFSDVFERMEKVRIFLAQLDKEFYHPKKVSEIRELNLPGISPLDLAVLENASSSWFWDLMQNSSTNMNRKRAAYILKRYFCDDLTPVNVVIPEDHSNDKHASAASCASCHYKLDPIAGFFRNRGRRGSKTSSDLINFDDGVNMSHSEYTRQWKDENGNWNVGLIKSTTDESQNIRPKDTTLSGLFEMIKNSKSSKECIVERAFEYFIDEDMSYDGSFKQKFKDEFIKKSKTDSSQALKDMVKGLVSTASFVTDSPEKGKCYDYVGGAAPDLPCPVAHVIQKYCTSCHSGSGAMGGLDLSTWNEFTGFPHEDSTLSKQDVLTRIQERLTTDDPDLRMPLQMHIDSNDLQLLFEWTTLKIEE